MGFGGSGGSGSSIAGATDTTLNNPINNEVLTYDGTTSMWKNAEGGGGGGPITIADLPAGCVLYARYHTGTSTWPARPTARTDIMVHWIGANESTPPPAAVNGVDLWDWNGS